MTCGIYLISFRKTRKVYIGQSMDIRTRYLQHLRSFRNGTASDKLLKAYQQYKRSSVILLEECKESELNTLEQYYIDKYSSIDHGLNTNTVRKTVLPNDRYKLITLDEAKLDPRKYLYPFLVNTPINKAELQSYNEEMYST